MWTRHLGVALLALVALGGCTDEATQSPSPSASETAEAKYAVPDESFCRALVGQAGVEERGWQFTDDSHAATHMDPGEGRMLCDLEGEPASLDDKTASMQVIATVRPSDLAERDYEHNSQVTGWVVVEEPQRDELSGWWQEAVRYSGDEPGKPDESGHSQTIGHSEQHWIHDEGLVIQIRLKGAYVRADVQAMYEGWMADAAEALRDAVPEVLG